MAKKILNFLYSLNMPVKLVAGAGLLLIIYGYLCRPVGIYLFWESKYIGFAIFIIGVIVFLIGNIKNKRPNDKRSLGEKIGISVLVFILFVQFVLYFVILNSNAFAAVRIRVDNDENLQAEIGDVQSVSLVPIGTLSVSTSGGDEVGEGYIQVIVKGDRKYKDLVIELVKQFETDWKISYDQ